MNIFKSYNLTIKLCSVLSAHAKPKESWVCKKS